MSISMNIASTDGTSNTVELMSFSFGADNETQLTSAAGAGAGKVAFKDFSITKKTDKSSVTLFQACATGKHFNNVIISTSRSKSSANTGMAYLRFTFSNVAIKTIDWGGSSGDDSPSESIVFVYGALQIEYTDQSTGAVDTAKFETAELIYYPPFPPAGW